MNFVDSILFTKLVKSGEDFSEKSYSLSWVKVVLTHLSYSCQVSKNQSEVIKNIDLSLFISNHSKNMEWNKSADQHIRFLDLNIEDSLVVERFSLNHLSMMDAHSQEN